MSEPLNMSHLDVKHNLVGFEVYYRDMAEELVNNTIAYGPFDLFCDIGGALGLMLGASIATVVESFDFFVRYRYGKLRILRQTESQLWGENITYIDTGNYLACQRKLLGKYTKELVRH